MWPNKADLLYCIVFLHLIFFSMHEFATHKAAFILLSSPSRGVPLSLNDPSPPKHIQLEADQNTGTANEMTLQVRKTPSANMGTESAQVCLLC